MKKNDLKKLALMGITGGMMLASQGAVAATGSSAPVMLAANSCGGGGGYYPSSGSNIPNSNYAPNGGNVQNSCGGGTYSSGNRGASGYYVPETGLDEGSVSEDDQPAGMRNQPGAQPNGCSNRSGCGGIKPQQSQTSQQIRNNQPQNQPYQAPQQMMPQGNAPSGQGPTNYQDNAAKRADMNNR